MGLLELHQKMKYIAIESHVILYRGCSTTIFKTKLVETISQQKSNIFWRFFMKILSSANFFNYLGLISNVIHNMFDNAVKLIQL